MAAPSYVFTIARVAIMLGEDEAWLEEIALEMEPEDGRLYTLYPDISARASRRRGYRYRNVPHSA